METERLLGKLEEFRSWAKTEFTEINTQLNDIKQNLVSLNYFRVRVYFGATLVSIMAAMTVEFIKGVLRL